jgi:probable HAF family extracellular repeat protein
LATDTLNFDINASGEIVGWYFAGNVFHGLLRSTNNIYTTLDDPSAGPLGTFAQSINDEGQIVGRYVDANDVSHGFLYSNGTFTTLDYPLGVGTAQVPTRHSRRC